MENSKYMLTKSKLEDLQKELASLETKGRQEIADYLDWLRSQPNDLEDVTFSDVLDDKNFLEKRISELKEIINNVEILEGDSREDIVQLGTTVKVGFEGYEEEYTIVSALEADPFNNKISDKSPVGEALIGSKVGDTITVETGPVKKKFRILNIN